MKKSHNLHGNTLVSDKCKHFHLKHSGAQVPILSYLNKLTQNQPLAMCN